MHAGLPDSIYRGRPLDVVAKGDRFFSTGNIAKPDTPIRTKRGRSTSRENKPSPEIQNRRPMKPGFDILFGAILSSVN